MLKIHAGGNVGSDVLQIMWFMGFNKVIVVGYGDASGSYEEEIHQQAGKSFTWDRYGLDSIPIHSSMWSKDPTRTLKILLGGEVLKRHGEFPAASWLELQNNLDSKDHLVEKIRRIQNET